MPTDHHPILLFDGVCNLCNGSVQFIIERDPEGVFRFASLQSDVGKEMLQRAGLPTEELKSLVLYEGGRFYTRSDAALRAARHLGGGWSLLYGLRVIPRIIRDTVYDFIARNRYRWFGKEESCMVPTAELRGRFLDQD